MVALALFCRWLPLPSCCGDCCPCLQSVVVGSCRFPCRLVALVSFGGGCLCLPLVVVCGWGCFFFASFGRGRLPWRLFESAQSGTTVEREIVRLVKDTPCHRNTHTTKHAMKTDTRSHAPANTQHGDTIRDMTKQHCTTTNKHNTRKHRFLDVGSPQLCPTLLFDCGPATGERETCFWYLTDFDSVSGNTKCWNGLVASSDVFCCCFAHV